MRKHVVHVPRWVPDRISLQDGMNLLGEWVRRSRIRAGMSQTQLGRASGVHQTTISRLERGRLEGLRLHRLAAIVAVLQGHLVELPMRPR